MQRPPKPGQQIDVGPVTVERSKEVTQCTYMKLPGKKDLAVNRVRIKVSGGSHHVHLYRAQDPTMTVADHAEPCNMALDFSVWQLVLASQSLYLDWKLPPGLAFHFTKGEQLVAQTHFVDSGLLTTPTGQGFAIFDLYSMPPKKVTSYVGAFFGQDRDVVVPPGFATATTKCIFPKPVNLLAITGHYHYRGVKLTASTWDGYEDHATELLYNQDGYLDPAFIRFNEQNSPQIQGVQWTCDYQNPTDTTFKFGPFTDVNEHCNLFLFYYPTGSPQEDMTCVQKGGIAATTVHAN
jgi:hypothetical protein